MDKEILSVSVRIGVCHRIPTGLGHKYGEHVWKWYGPTTNRFKCELCDKFISTELEKVVRELKETGFVFNPKNGTYQKAIHGKKSPKKFLET